MFIQCVVISERTSNYDRQVLCFAAIVCSSRRGLNVTCVICPNFANAFSPSVQLIRLSAECVISLSVFASLSLLVYSQRFIRAKCETEFCSNALRSRADSGTGGRYYLVCGLFYWLRSICEDKLKTV